MIYAWIAVGSALGGMARYWIGGLIDQRIGETFPWGTMVVNITGCLVIGFVATLTAPDGRLLMNPSHRSFVMIGLCGGYTTYSSFGLQTLNLARNSEWLRAGGYVLLTTVLCLAAVWAGHVLATGLNQMKGG
jgi:CrcB protein